LENGHPVIWVETYGHGIYGHEINLEAGEVVYRAGETAELPEGVHDDHATYQLISIYETLWAHRNEIGSGKLFDQLFNYRGHGLPAAFDGDTYGEDKANTPWGYDQALGDKLVRGDWFLDPAKALAYHATFPGTYSTRYVLNPYLLELEELSQ
jgi:hypothetical protein